jgi:hypothetical protein
LVPILAPPIRAHPLTDSQVNLTKLLVNRPSKPLVKPTGLCPACVLKKIFKNWLQGFHTNWGWVSSLKIYLPKMCYLYIRNLWISHLLVFSGAQNCQLFLDPHCWETGWKFLKLFKTNRN